MRNETDVRAREFRELQLGELIHVDCLYTLIPTGSALCTQRFFSLFKGELIIVCGRKRCRKKHARGALEWPYKASRRATGRFGTRDQP
jgi:hypothetical protein